MPIVPPGTFVHRHSSPTFDYMNFIHMGFRDIPYKTASLFECISLTRNDCPEQQLSLLNDPFLRFIDKNEKNIELNYLTLTGHHSVLPFQNNNRPHQESSPHAGWPGRNWIDIKRYARNGLILNKQHKMRSRSNPSCRPHIGLSELFMLGAECS